MSEPDVSNLMTVDQAIAMLDATPVVTRTRRVKLIDALGMRVAQDVRADRDYPPFEKSLMDGFAIRSGGEREFRIIGEVRAGEMSEAVVNAGEAMAIMTGAPLPAGADGVVPIEFTERSGDLIQLNRDGDFSRFISRRGSDCAAGAVVIDRGMKIESPQVAVAATVGAHELDVYAPPRVAILATGDELAAIDEADPRPFQMRNSNSLMLASLLARYGCEVTDLGVVRDEMPPMLEAISRGFEFDAFFITGGMSVGAYDLPPKALAQLGAIPQITKLKIKPGKPFLYARQKNCHIFGLPGNPLAGFVCTVRLASRVLRRLIGAPAAQDEVRAALAESLPANGPREFYQPAVVTNGLAQPLNWKSSADVFTLARANALLIRAESDSAQVPGAQCRLLSIG